jgi:radical SAM protein with 4Fe4S-binding SPASM domain
MDCTETIQPNNKEFSLRFNKKVAKQRIPFSGSIELTHRCNLRCVHCYLGDQADIRENRYKELNAARWIALIDEITEAGCLNLLITGGDPLLRKDFSKIYTHAKKNGLLVTVFTNGTLINHEHLELFDDLPPRSIEITLYGATAETYEAITGVKGSYKKCLAGIKKLLDHKRYLRLKTILMTINSHEFYEIKNMAKEFGVKFRFDADIFPRSDGNKSPLDLRVSPEEAIEKEMSDENLISDINKFFEKFHDMPVSDKLYQCGAGATAFHMSPYGNLQPCLMTFRYKYNLLEGNFDEGWSNMVPLIRKKKASAAFSCNKCENRALCHLCPALFDLENGAEDIRSEYICDGGRLRYNTYNTMMHNNPLTGS